MAKIALYSAPHCPYCKMAKRYLASHGIAFTEHDVASDENAFRAMEEASHQRGVPVIVIDREVFVGFDREALARKLGIR